jgi:polyhydroxyalkanoate synthesis regulator phasin
MENSLSNIEKKINHRIEEIKSKMEKTNLRAEIDRLWVRVETLQWALAQILAVRE